MEQKTLYDLLGGRVAIETVVNRLYDLIAADEAVSAYFNDSGMPRQGLADFLVVATGGTAPKGYAIPDLAQAHFKHHITDQAFATVGGYLAQALQEAKVPQELQAKVMDMVLGLKGQIVSQA